jgi:hypothetical protein
MIHIPTQNGKPLGLKGKTSSRLLKLNFKINNFKCDWDNQTTSKAIEIK